MTVTLLLSLMMMAGLFLMLWSGVGFIQDKRFFSSAPKEAQAVVPETKPERFRGQHIFGWCMAVFSIVLLIAPVFIGAWNGLQNGFSFGQFFLRFIIMIFLLKVFDIGFFDWVLLCNKGFGFFPHYYPEITNVYGSHLFGYNWKTHLSHIIGAFPVSALLAWICTLIG